MSVQEANCSFPTQLFNDQQCFGVTGQKVAKMWQFCMHTDFFVALPTMESEPCVF